MIFDSRLSRRGIGSEWFMRSQSCAARSFRKWHPMDTPFLLTNLKCILRIGTELWNEAWAAVPMETHYEILLGLTYA